MIQRNRARTYAQSVLNQDDFPALHQDARDSTRIDRQQVTQPDTQPQVESQPQAETQVEQATDVLIEIATEQTTVESTIDPDTEETEDMDATSESIKTKSEQQEGRKNKKRKGNHHTTTGIKPPLPPLIDLNGKMGVFSAQPFISSPDLENVDLSQIPDDNLLF